MSKGGMVAQGDILIERVSDDPPLGKRVPVEPDADGALVLGRGERSGHRHALHGEARMFRVEGLQSVLPSSLYVGHVVVTDARGAVLCHEEHASIRLRPGTYRVRRQRRYTSRQARTALVRD